MTTDSVGQENDNTSLQKGDAIRDLVMEITIGLAYSASTVEFDSIIRAARIIYRGSRVQKRVTKIYSMISQYGSTQNGAV